jgi:hypothetical protein
VWLRVGVAGVESIEEGLGGDLGMLIARSHAGARCTREGRETTRVEIVRHEGRYVTWSAGAGFGWPAATDA